MEQNITYKIIDVEQNTPQWLDYRKGKIGASMAAAIMCVSPWKTPLQLFEEIVFEKSSPPNAAMIRGSDLEQCARDWFNKTIGGDPFEPLVIESREYPWHLSSLDCARFVEGQIEIAELKLAGGEDHLTAIEGRVPEKYYPQVQHQMFDAGVDFCYYVSFDGKNGVALRVERDEKYIKKLISTEMAFFRSTIDFKPPEPTDRDRIAIDDPEEVVKAERYCEISRLIDELEIERADLKNALIENLKSPRVKIGHLEATKVVRKGTIAYDEIEVLQGIDLERYRKKPVVTWRLTY